MKKVSIIGTVGIPACYGGFESLVENLTKYANGNVSYQVFCSSKSYEEKLEVYNGAELTYIPFSANGVQSIPYDIFSLIKCLFYKPDVTLILGVSGCIFLPFYKLLSNSKIITNIDGLEWKRDKWNYLARKFLKLSEAIAVKYSDIVIADNQAIGDYVTNEYGKNNLVIAYGGDHVIPSFPIDIHNGDYFLSLCRIEPENNVEMILDAFSKSDNKLKFVGNWDKSEYGKSLKSKYKDFPNIDIINPVYDIDKLYVLRKGCLGYIHGHSAGGTNPSLVEAMHFSKPIYAYDCSFNRYTTEESAFYFSSSKSLLEIIEKTRNKDSGHLKNSAMQMKEIAGRRYTWEVVSNQYESCY